MANDITGYPWIIDTAATITVNNRRIVGMVWKPSAASESLIIHDRYGREIWNQTSLAASPAGDLVFDQSEPFLARGFVVNTITASGVLWVWVK